MHFISNEQQNAVVLILITVTLPLICEIVVVDYTKYINENNAVIKGEYIKNKILSNVIIKGKSVKNKTAGYLFNLSFLKCEKTPVMFFYLGKTDSTTVQSTFSHTKETQ